MRIGLDLVTVEQAATLISGRPDGEGGVFAEQELEAAGAMEGRRRSEFLAGRFAVKEAFVKAVGGTAGIDPRDIACLAQPSGAPALEVRGSALAARERVGCERAAVSISHDGGLAAAVVVLT